MPGRVHRPVAERLWEKVDKTDTCWLWTGFCIGGYGVIGEWDKSFMAHRLAYELLIGPIPDGLVIDHLCRVRNCVNPDHLEPVTLAENIRRGEVGRHNATKTVCPQGHEYTEVNTYWYRGTRSCRTCGREKQRRFRNKSH